MSTTFYLHAPATTAIYTLSLHDALPILAADAGQRLAALGDLGRGVVRAAGAEVGRALDRNDRRRQRTVLGDRKSTRLNSSHMSISYAVFCLKKKKIKENTYHGSEPTTHR